MLNFLVPISITIGKSLLEIESVIHYFKIFLVSLRSRFLVISQQICMNSLECSTRSEAKFLRLENDWMADL